MEGQKNTELQKKGQMKSAGSLLVAVVMCSQLAHGFTGNVFWANNFSGSGGSCMLPGRNDRRVAAVRIFNVKHLLNVVSNRSIHSSSKTVRHVVTKLLMSFYLM